VIYEEGWSPLWRIRDGFSIHNATEDMFADPEIVTGEYHPLWSCGGYYDSEKKSYFSFPEGRAYPTTFPNEET
jgi:hypothetical protein